MLSGAARFASSARGRQPAVNEGTMKKSLNKSEVVNQVDADEILPEYDFSRASRNKYASRYAAGSAVVVLEPDVAAAVPLAAILFQVYVPMFFPFLSFLEMPLLVVVYFAIMRRSQISGLMEGALVGLAQDSLSKNPLGMFGIVKTLVGYFAASVGVRLDVEHGLIRLLLGFFFYLFHQFLYWVMARALLGQQLTFDWQRTAMLAGLNAVVGVALFHLLDKLKERT